MSRQHRKHGIWPANDLARAIWHLVAATEDIVDLFEASKDRTSEGSSLALMKKALVEFCSFDDLVRELGSAIRDTDTEDLPELEWHELLQGLRAYNLVVEPSRAFLRDLRNTVGAHRTGKPKRREVDRFGTDFDAWGKWEQHLAELEAQCSRERWVDVLNAGLALRNLVVDRGMGHWFSSGDKTIRLYIPVRLG